MNKLKLGGLEIEFEDGIEITVKGRKLTIKSAEPFRIQDGLNDAPIRRQIELSPYVPNVGVPYQPYVSEPYQPYVGDIVQTTTTGTAFKIPDATYTVTFTAQDQPFTFTSGLLSSS